MHKVYVLHELLVLSLSLLDAWERKLSKSHVLSPEETTMHRPLNACANYLAQDRPDLAFSTKELCKELAIPNTDSYAKLERNVQYLIGRPKMVYVYD